jgi:predicted lipase
LAAFSALEVSLMLQSKDVGMYSFGEPRIGNKFFAEFWGEWVPRGMRVVHTDDVVPHLPPRGESILLLTDFHHTSTEVREPRPVVASS